MAKQQILPFFVYLTDYSAYQQCSGTLETGMIGGKK